MCRPALIDRRPDGGIVVPAVDLDVTVLMRLIDQPDQQPVANTDGALRHGARLDRSQLSGLRSRGWSAHLRASDPAVRAMTAPAEAAGLAWAAASM